MHVGAAHCGQIPEDIDHSENRSQKSQKGRHSRDDGKETKPAFPAEQLSPNLLLGKAFQRFGVGPPMHDCHPKNPVKRTLFLVHKSHCLFFLPVVEMFAQGELKFLRIRRGRAEKPESLQHDSGGQYGKARDSPYDGSPG